jgi:hypothetical protein
MLNLFGAMVALTILWLVRLCWFDRHSFRPPATFSANVEKVASLRAMTARISSTKLQQHGTGPMAPWKEVRR